MTRPILLAGLLGGLLGGAGAFVVARLLPPSTETELHSMPGKAEPRSEAREVVEAFLRKLKDMKYQEFVGDVKMGRNFMSDQEFDAFKRLFLESRTQYHGVFGKLTGEYDLIRETVLRPDLVRYVYLEKFEHGSLVWLFILYHTKDGWRLNTISWNPDLSHAFPGGS